MQYITKQLPKDHNLFLFGDDHEGSRLRYDEGWRELVDMMHSSYKSCSNNYGLHHGDFAEFIQTDDKRYSFEVTQGNPQAQMEAAEVNIRPIASKLVCMLDSNHPRTLHRFGDLSAMLCKALNVPYGTYSCRMSYVDKEGKLMYKHYATHGRKGINSSADDPLRQRANMKLSLKRHLKAKAGDCVVMSKAHTHKLLVCEPEPELYLTDTDGVLHQHYTKPDQTAQYIPHHQRYYINTGSFLKLYPETGGYSGYGELAEYDPHELGFVILVVRDGIIQSADKIVI